MARPSKHTEETNELVYKLALLGATDKEIADILGVTETTINNWKKSKRGFFESLTKGKMIADAEIAEALYHRVKGYSHPEDKIFHNGTIAEPTVVRTTKHYPPDTGAAFIWLKNRRSNDWRDKREEAETNGTPFDEIEITSYDG